MDLREVWKWSVEVMFGYINIKAYINDTKKHTRVVSVSQEKIKNENKQRI